VEPNIREGGRGAAVARARVPGARFIQDGIELRSTTHPASWHDADSPAGAVARAAVPSTDRRHAEEATFASTLRLGSVDPDIPADVALRLFEASFDQQAMGMAIRSIDPANPRWIRVNDKLCEILGYSREELLALTSVDVSLPEEREASIAFNEQMMRGEIGSYSREKRYLRKDGEVVWTNLWLAPVLDADGTPVMVVSMIQDITGRKRDEATLHEAENRFRSVVDSSPAGITLKDAEGRFLVVNRTYARWMGVRVCDLIGKNAHDVFPRDQADQIRSDDAAVIASGEEASREAVRTFRDGVSRTVISHKSVVRSAQGEPIAVSTVITDITARIAAEAAVREREQRFRDFAESTSDWFWETDSRLRFTYLSERFYQSTGLAPDTAGEVEFNALGQQAAVVDGDAPGGSLAAALEARAAFKDHEQSFVATDGSVRHARISGRPVFGEDGGFLGYRGTGTDITEAHNLSRQLSWQAAHDPLTRLINRREFERRLGHMLASAVSGADEHALCYVDLDQFKVINDTCGHVAGDELLRQLGQILPAAVRRNDTVARLGGDEFGLLLEHCTIERALRVSEGLRERLADFRFAWGEQVFQIGASIGLVPIGRQGWSVEDALRVADSACYAAKDGGRDRVHVVRPGDPELARRDGEMRWVARLNRALEEGRFRLWSQPILPASGVRDGAEHVELLLRMVDERGELISPGAFLPAAERYGLSTRLDRWVVDAALAWLDRNPHRLRSLALCSINLSGASLGDDEVLRHVRERLARSAVPPDRICFEITETAAIANLARGLDFMHSLRELGCRFSLDDFGSGLSSFGYLKTLPVEYLKIDGTFVRDILHDEVDLALVRAISDVGKAMGKKTIAEFVESDAVARRVRELGIDYVQGFGVGRPAPVRDDG